MNRDTCIDAYIAKAQPFARPILEHVRERVHALIPEVEEAIRWGHPAYLKDGNILLGTAAFKGHASVHFWRGQELGFDVKDGAMGQLGKLKDFADLPQHLDAMIQRAAELSAAPVPRKAKHPPKPLPDMHPEFASALQKSPRAKAQFEGLAPSHQREYLEWIQDAKQEATREKRIATAIEWIGDGKRRNWKYEKC
ncbi:MAG TPA: YdeI/OmpD-associated family protein [Sphingomicrobium sp.]|nr:YdeI/OmpD-associated family protein [Sphingomicrobium sp.]